MNEDEVRSRMPLTGNQMFTAGGEPRNREGGDSGGTSTWEKGG